MKTFWDDLSSIHHEILPARIPMCNTMFMHELDTLIGSNENAFLSKRIHGPAIFASAPQQLLLYVQKEGRETRGGEA